MAFDYYLVDDEDRQLPAGLFAVNRDPEAGRLDTMIYSHLRQRWVSDPSAVTQYLFGQDYVERRRLISRAEADEAAATLGVSVPTEEELMRISDEAERRRVRQRRWRLNPGRQGSGEVEALGHLVGDLVDAGHQSGVSGAGGEQGQPAGVEHRDQVLGLGHGRNGIGSGHGHGPGRRHPHGGAGGQRDHLHQPLRTVLPGLGRCLGGDPGEAFDRQGRLGRTQPAPGQGGTGRDRLAAHVGGEDGGEEHLLFPKLVEQRPQRPARQPLWRCVWGRSERRLDRNAESQASLVAGSRSSTVQ